jgi:pimeloyl-ACP methyl ester carboxylesterase
MGGLIGMLFAAQPNSPICRLVLNDVGPLVPWSALVRLNGHADRTKRFATPAEVEAFLRDVCSPFGRLSDEQWGHLAEHGAQQQPDGSYALRYDPEILHTLRSGGALEGPRGERFLEGVDLWPVWDSLRCGVLAIRGAESDVLTERTAREMESRGPRAQVIEIPYVGHAPALMDPEQVEPIRRFLLEQDEN